MRTPLRPEDPRRLGGYSLLARLGQGGMGTVYLAEDADGRRVAVKVIRPDLTSDPQFRARFRSEVSRARQVPPFCTAAVLDADPEHPTPYLVVEYVEGADLDQLIRKRGPLTGGELHSVAVGVATALAAIHSAGVIHRDLKPGNVLFSLGAPKVIDFGIARAAESSAPQTRPDEMVGTIAYMAPERFATESPAPASPAADVFAWGVLVGYAATGRTPFAGDSPMATAARILTQPPDLAGLPATLRPFVTAALDKDPDRRPTAHELLTRLLSPADADAAADLADRPQLRWAALAARNNGPGVTDLEGAAQAWAFVAARRRRRRAVRLLAGLTAAALVVAGMSAVPPVRAAIATVGQRIAIDPGGDLSALTLADDLRGPGPWQADPRQVNGQGDCYFVEHGLAVQGWRRDTPYLCGGPDRTFTDPIIVVSVRQGEGCAVVVLRMTAEGNVRVMMCPDHLVLDVERNRRRTVVSDVPVPDGDTRQPRILKIISTGPNIDVVMEGTLRLRGRVPDGVPVRGRLGIGTIGQPVPSPEIRGDAIFADVRVWEP